MRRPAWGLIAGALALAAGCDRPAPPPSPEVIAGFAASLPRGDPSAKAWEAAPEHVAKLLLQDQTAPKLVVPGVELLRVRALHDGKWIAFRLEWEDATRSGVAGPAMFGDMVAVQLPFEGGGNVTDAAMGLAGRPVRISLWRATSEALLASADKDMVRLAYPNAAIDHYPFQAATQNQEAMALLYAPARAVGNPTAVRRADSATEDLVSEGFGSLTPAPEQVSAGRGRHDGRRWQVVIARPLDAKAGAALLPGGRTYAAFAVWDGAKQNVGSRKMRSGWIGLSLGVSP